MITRTWVVLWVLGAGLASGCSMAPQMASEEAEWSQSAALDDMGVAGGTLGVEVRSEFAATAAPVADPFSGEDQEGGAAEPERSERKLVYTGWLRMAVADRVQAGQAASSMTESLGGYVQVLSDESVTLRIPVDRWEEALDKAAEIGRVVNRQLRVQDVTEEFLDIDLQLKNLRTLSDRLSELLAKAETVEAALKVEKELARVRSDIERLEGRLKYLKNNIAFATLTIELVQIAEARPTSARLPFPWLEQLGIERLLGLPGGGP